MSRKLLGAVLVLALVALVVSLVLVRASQPAPPPSPGGALGAERASEGAPAAADAPPADLPSAEGSDVDHGHDYEGATVEDLIGHVDHLDFDRLEPALRSDLLAELDRRDELSLSLWDAYGSAVQPGPMPPAWEALEAEEVAYLLLSVRASQLADAATRAGSVDAARSLPEVGREHGLVAVSSRSYEDDVCVVLTPSFDAYDRTFSAVGRAPDVPLGDRLEQHVFVSTVDQEGCFGNPPSLSPAAADALAAARS